MKKQLILNILIASVLTLTSCSRKVGCYYSLNPEEMKREDGPNDNFIKCIEVCGAEHLQLTTNEHYLYQTIISN